MKKIAIALSTLVTAFVTTAMITKKEAPAPPAQMGTRLVEALRNASSEQYVSLFPTVSEFDETMTEKSRLYGENLAEAKEEFARDYISNLIPQVKESFEAVLAQGREKGIDWRTIRYVGIEIEAEPAQRFGTAPATIVVASGPKEYRIKLDRALMVNGQWKVSQFIKLL
jgi:hypothetical protein